MRVALKFAVLDCSGAREGVPALLRLLDTYRLQASFAFVMGVGELPWWRRGLGFGRSMQVCAARAIRAAVEAGHEAGLAGLDAGRWRRDAAFADAARTAADLDKACAAFEDAAGRPPLFFAAAHWQVNPHLLAGQVARGWAWASDTRGRYPFLPQLQGVRSGCVQIPTTLPTMDEVLASGAAKAADVHEYLYAESRHVRPAGHVYSGRADREGRELLPQMEKLLVMWKGYEGSVRPLGRVFAEIDPESLPVHQVGWDRVAGRDGYVAMQSVEIPK
jgi:peptidoglycan/xylan/chitin deacetylase (PgdA/CDA1 family)